VSILEKKLQDYAKLIVRIGVNVQKNQVVVINSIIEAYPLTRLVVEQSYKVGAKKVIINWNDGQITKANYSYQSLETLLDIPQYEIDHMNIPVVQDGACRINIGGNSPEMLKGVDSLKISEITKKNGIVFKSLRD
jgi:aminopeptidase